VALHSFAVAHDQIQGGFRSEDFDISVTLVALQNLSSIF
jgi:hypothetical protein